MPLDAPEISATLSFNLMPKVSFVFIFSLRR
jgi:hypothetical protein